MKEYLKSKTFRNSLILVAIVSIIWFVIIPYVIVPIQLLFKKIPSNVNRHELIEDIRLIRLRGFPKYAKEPSLDWYEPGMLMPMNFGDTYSGNGYEISGMFFNGETKVFHFGEETYKVYKYEFYFAYIVLYLLFYPVIIIYNIIKMFEYIFKDWKRKKRGD